MKKPMVRNNICINVNPEGLQEAVLDEIAFVKTSINASTCAPKTALILGCSAGFGLSSRIALAFGYQSYTVGVSYERQATDKKTGSPGYYNNREFDKQSELEGVGSWTLETDAFSHEAKEAVIEHIQAQGKTFDLVIYSLASAVRKDPDTDTLYKSSLKPIGKSYAGKSIDYMTEKLSDLHFEAATAEEIEGTVKVMGGEDWALWVHALKRAGVLSHGVKTMAYSYVGPELSHDIYREGCIGKAKLHLEQTSRDLSKDLSDIDGKALISVNKALVTRASAVIPGIALYIAVLFSVMKDAGTHEGCAEQIARLFNEKLFGDTIDLDENGFIRIDDWEMDATVQDEVLRRMNMISQENLRDLADIDGIRHDFLRVHGFINQ